MSIACNAQPEIILSPSEFSPDKHLDIHSIFSTDQPLEIDMGCGKGRFLRARALKAPQLNFLGVDRMLKRLKKVEAKVRRENLANVRLIQIEGSYLVEHMLPPASVSAYYIFFPDPWPKRRHHRRRLFSPLFVKSLYRSLVPGGAIHIATDHLEYFEVIREAMEEHPGFVEIETFVPEADEQTNFEMIFLGQQKEIGRGSFRRK